MIISKSYRKKGFAKEALNLLSEYAFFILGTNHLYCSITKDNLASIKLFVSCGFELEKEVKDLQYFIKLAKKLK